MLKTLREVTQADYTDDLFHVLVDAVKAVIVVDGMGIDAMSEIISIAENPNENVAMSRIAAVRLLGKLIIVQFSCFCSIYGRECVCVFFYL